jgi:glycosyltransferase involved in cell wall biosynthesis
MGHEVTVSAEPPSGSPDVIVLSKHDLLNPRIAETGKKMGSRIVFDICDDHFENTEKARIYIDTAKLADRVTTITQHHADKIRDYCGVKATVIDDPYEWDEARPKKPTDKLFWCGMGKNWAGLMDELPKLHGYQILCVGEPVDPRIVPWSWEAMEQGFQEAGLMILPNPKKGNGIGRVINAIRNGLYVVTSPWPETDHLGMWQGDIKKGVDWAIENPKQAKRAVMKAQKIVQKMYSPEKIGKDWEAVFKSKTEIY